MNEKWLAEVILDSPNSVMYVVICRIIWKEELERIVGERIATVIVYGFEGRKCEKKDGLPYGHAR